MSFRGDSRTDYMPRVVICAAAVAALCLAIEPERDFTGRWLLDTRQSDMRRVSVPPQALLDIAQQGEVVQCTANGGAARWSYRLDGGEVASQVSGETHNSAAKWEGSALLINTLVSGPRSYVVMDRWKLSRDRNTLTVSRQVMRGTAQTE